MKDIEEQIDRNARIWMGVQVMAIVFLVLLGRLFWLQVVSGDRMLRIAEDNRLRLERVMAPRGLLLDREGRALVRNRPSWNVVLEPDGVRGHREHLRQVLLGLRRPDGTILLDTIQVDRALLESRRPSLRPVVLEDASWAELAIILENRWQLPGVATDLSIRREYPFGPLAAHVLGNIGEVGQDELERLEPEGYRMGDNLGRDGLERHYEHLLRGHHGLRYVEVDVHSRVVGVPPDLPSKEPRSGQHLRLTLDLDLQKVAEEALPDTLQGAVVALDPSNGEILAMASRPSFDPNFFSLSARRRAAFWRDLVIDPNRPLLHRAVAGLYEPGSTFKIITSLAGLEVGRVDQHTRFPTPCRGSYFFGNRRWGCWKPAGHGSTNKWSAMATSCAVYYYQLALALGMTPINDVARRMGLGAATGIDLPGEVGGMLVDSASHEQRHRHRGWRWTRGLVLNLGMGQGQLVTPLQLAWMVGGLGSKGPRPRPHLLQAVLDPHTRNVHSVPSVSMAPPTQLSAVHDSLMRAILVGSVESSIATGRRGRVEGLLVGGKTGSAENPHGEKTHALFVTFAPADAPRIAVSVVLENAGGGGARAAPIAQQVLQKWHQKRSAAP